MRSYAAQYIELSVLGKEQPNRRTLLVRARSSGGLMVATHHELNAMHPSQAENILTQIELMGKISHPNILRLIDTFLEKGWITIITEYCEEGDLATLIAKRRRSVHFS